jgi:hypothetical protein
MRLIPIRQLDLHRNVSPLTGCDRNVRQLRNPGLAQFCDHHSRQGIRIGFAFALLAQSHPRRMRSGSSKTGSTSSTGRLTPTRKAVSIGSDG